MTLETPAPDLGAGAPPVMSWARPGAALRRAFDRLTYALANAGAIGVSALIALMAVVLGYGSLEAFHALGFSFLVSQDWDPTNASFGALPALWGTLLSSLLALLFAVPLSLGIAVFLTRLAPRWLAGPASFVVELLAAIPSIAYGFWGAEMLVPFMQKHIQPDLKLLFGHVWPLSYLVAGPAYGFGMLTAGVVLAIMVTPIITAIMREVLRSAPRELDEAAYALGATWFQASRMMVAACKTGIFGAVVLGFARAIGETMAVTMVIGNRDQVSASLFAPGQTMASLLANEFLEADKSVYTSALIEIALVLLVTTLVTSALARWMIMRSSRIGKKAPRAVANQPTSVATAAAVSLMQAAANAPRSEPMLLPQRIDLSVSPFRRACDWAARLVAIGSAGLAGLFLVAILAYILEQGVSGLSWNFFTQLPGALGAATGMSNCIKGSIALVGMASVIGIPFGIACGIYLSEYGKTSRKGVVVRVLVDVLGSVPSIVVGVVAYVVLVKHGIGHYSGFAGALALALLMCPIIARTTEEMLLLVPNAMREASLGAGATMAQTIWRVVLPSAMTGIITGVVLSVARVAGETAPLLFTALGFDGKQLNPMQPFPALPLKIFQYATSPEDEWKKQAWAGMLVLIALILILNAALRLWAYSRTKAR